MKQGLLIADRVKIADISYKVIGAAFRVGRELGPGFLEKVYENALAIELAADGLEAEQQRPVAVVYKEKQVGNYVIDLLVERELVVEVKAVKAFDPSHISQCVHYLRATGLNVGLLLNFGQRSVQYRRVLHRS